jgi:hypothetical protein
MTALTSLRREMTLRRTSECCYGMGGEGTRNWHGGRGLVKLQGTVGRRGSEAMSEALTSSFSKCRKSGKRCSIVLKHQEEGIMRW